MNFIKNFFVAFFVFVAGFFFFGIGIVINWWIGTGIDLALLVGGAILFKGLFRLPERFPRHKASAVGMILASIIVLPVVLAVQSTENAEKMAELKASNPDAYLLVLKQEKGDTAWLEALKELKPEKYKEEIDQREAVELAERERLLAEEIAEEERKKEERATEIAKLLKELRIIPASKFRENAVRYKRLTELDPSNEVYREKYQRYQAKADQERRWLADPDSALKIRKWSWSKDGFSNIMIATFTIKNNANFDIKDVEITCVHSSPSGTVIDRNTRTIYEIFQAGKTRTIREFNMGFIHSQAQRSGCTIMSAVRR